MTRIVWGTPSERFFEAGIDRGVLYTTGSLGVPWSGLISVDESPDGGEARPYYYDGIKYLNIATSEEFVATLVAYGHPIEFNACDGVAQIHNGLFATQQRRESFGLSYRSLIGNSLEGSEHGYKIHLVYGCLAAPSERTNRTLSDSADPVALSWQITTLPPSITGYKRTAHLVVDSRYTDPEVLSTLEDVLYGSESETAFLPTPDEVIAIFAA